MSAAAIEVPRLDDLTGAQRAAILVMYLERPTAKAVLQHLGDDELQEVGEAIATIDRVPAEVVDGVVASFVRDMTEACLVPTSGPAYALDVFPDLVDEARRARLVSGLRRKLSKRLVAEVARYPARTVAALLRDEHPQTRAVALLMIEENQAADILTHFTDEERHDTAMRMARIERLPGELVDDVEEMLITALQGQPVAGWEVKGVDRAAKILGRLNAEDQAIVLEQIAQNEPELSDTLRRRMVVFEDLSGLDDKSMQTVLKSIERDKLVVSLRGAPSKLLDLVLRNMSSRAAADLAEEIDLLGPKPKAIVDGARDEIVQLVIRLRDEGVVTLATGGGDELL